MKLLKSVDWTNKNIFILSIFLFLPAGNYLFKVNNGNTNGRCSSVFIVDFKQVFAQCIKCYPDIPLIISDSS